MYGIMINSKECAAEDKPGYFICLSQQKEKGIHMNTFLQSVQNLDGEILLQIQQHLRTDMLTPFMKIVTFLGNGGWFWILCAVVLLAVPKTRKTGYAAVLSLIFGVIVTNLLLKNIVARPRPFAEIEALIPLIAKLSMMVLESTPEVTENAILDGMFALINPVITLTDGRCVAMTR